MEVCRPIYRKQKISRQSFIKDKVWKLFLACLMLAGAVRSIVISWGDLRTDRRIIVVMTAVALCSAVCAEVLRKKNTLAWGFLALPWIVLLVITRFHGYWTGAKAWFYTMSIRWNLLEEGGGTLIQSGIDTQGVLSFSLILVVLCGELVWILAAGRHVLLAGWFCMSWMLVEVCSGTFSPIAGTCLMIGLFGLMISSKREFSGRSVIWVVCAAAILFLGMILFQKEEKIQSVESLRQEVQKTVHEVRYGKDTLPEGDLRQAATLQQDEREQLTVQTEQEKNLYLRGFVGGVYDEGIWKKLSNAVYVGENTGMMKWLEEQGFYPLSQVSEYYRLGEAENLPDTNQVKIHLNQASSFYVYAPTSVRRIKDRNIQDQKEMRLKSKGLFGKKNYSYEEISGSRPAELTVADSWVTNPETEEQKKYCEAESVYRRFVYENYTEPTEELKDLIQEYFWEDYESESDGIYSALSQIREKLRKGVSYTKEPEETPGNEDPVRWFLTESREGNSMLYASAAVEAFRVHGIPARYVEGYYLSSSDVKDSEDGEVSLTGANAHAWAEVYFDGVGWLPVDVTPGYYYDAVTLQQMVGSPDVVRKKAALEDNSYGADQMEGTEGNGQTAKSKVPSIMKNIGILLLGIAAMFLLILALVVVLVELIRIFSMWKIRTDYQNATKEQRLWMLERMIYFWLKLWGVESRLGWNTEKIDREIAEKIAAVQPGQYTRVSELLEKVVYGDIILERYEERTLVVFLKKIVTADASCNWKIKMKLRYASSLIMLDEFFEKRRMRRQNNELRRNKEM